MEFAMEFAPTDVVYRICLNLEGAASAEEALHAWSPLVSALNPVAMEFAVAHPEGLRKGYVADLLVARPLSEDELKLDAGEHVRSLLVRLKAHLLTVTVEADGHEAQAELRFAAGDGPYGVYLVFAAIGHDPLNPAGDRRDYPDTDEDL
ncbi:hypothetical protein ACFVH6_43610 [Spirillospora sp. NPDC127200]